MTFQRATIPSQPLGPIHVTCSCERSSLRDDISFYTLNQGLDTVGNFRVTSQQYEVFTGVKSSEDGLLTMSLFEFASMVSLAFHGNNEFLKALAKVLLPKLQALASPKSSMPAVRFHSESLVKLLGQKVEFTERGMSKAKGIFEGGVFTRRNGVTQYILRIGGKVPWESALCMSSLANSSCAISRCE